MSDEHVSIAEAKARFADLVHQAEAGQVVRISRRGKPVAVLLSLAEFEQLQSPRGGWVAYGADLTATAHQELVLETAMQAALAAGEFHVRYQPQVDVASGRVTGAEALVRWHRDSGVVTPDRFIPAAEATGVIVPSWLALGE